MKIHKKADLFIYRIKEKGLEIFMVNDEEQTDGWQIPQGPTSEHTPPHLRAEDHFIELDPVKQEDGKVEQAYAVEGDWHDIPSLKNMLIEDVEYVKAKIKEMEKGTFFGLKEAFKKVLPHQYEFLKELKEIITDRNTTKYL